MVRKLMAMILIGGVLAVNPSIQFRCHQLAEVARSIAIQRDHGIPPDLVKSAAGRTKHATFLVDLIYNTGASIPPHVIYDLVYSECIITSSSE